MTPVDDQPIAWVNGDLVPLSEARVHVLDQGFRTGEGVFETMRAYDGHTFRLDAHLDRASAGADRLGFVPPSRDNVAGAVTAAVRANAHLGGDLAVRLTVTPGPLDPDAAWPPPPLGMPTVVVTVHELQLSPVPYEHGVAAVTVPWARELANVKAVSYLAASLARREAEAQGAAEAILTDGSGHLVEGASSNLFVVRDGGLITPPRGPDLLPGVTRATVLDVAPAAGVTVREAHLGAADLATADEAFLTSSTRELVPLIEVDGRVIGTGRPGPVTGRLLAAYRAEVTRERAT